MNADDREPIIYVHRFFYTLQRLPASGAYLFVSHACPPVNSIQFRLIKEKERGLLCNRSLLLDHEGRLGLFIGEVYNCEKQWSPAGALKVDKRTEIIVATVVKPKQLRGCCKVQLNGELLLAWIKEIK